jgi:hypothetical protein
MPIRLELALGSRHGIPAGHTAGVPTMATVQEDDRTAARGQWTIKSKMLDAETVNAVRLAAAKAGVALGDWAATRLREAALAELGRPVEKPQPPATLDDVADKLAERMAVLVAQEVAQLRQEHAADLANLARRDRVRARWRR